MTWIGDLLRWFSGGREGYMSLSHCLNGDTFWIALTVILDFAVALGYVLIARHWWINEKSLPTSQAKTALASMKRIFLLCGMCGYLFIPVKMFWPAWRLYDLFLIGLVFFTWRYAMNARHLRVVYHELGRTKQLAYELEESRAQSRRKSFFLNAISHDLRTPLNGLMLQADLAELSIGSDPESLRDALREIKSCARTTADLLGSFLELGKLDWSEDSTMPSLFPAAEVVGALIAAAGPLAERKSLKIRVDAPAGLLIRTDRVKLEGILRNVIENAVKFTDRGSISVEVRFAGRDASFAVSDTGLGIPQGELATVFEDFYQADNTARDRSKGFGLGLAIARRLARQLRGELSVESVIGEGSRFTLALPGVVEGGAEIEAIVGPPASRR